MLPLTPNIKFSIGNDIVYLPEFKHSLTEYFITKVYTERELHDCQTFHTPLIRFASTWAAKEACYKAIKQLYPELRFWWKSLEIVRKKENQVPYLNFTKFPIPMNTSLSISHDGNYCWAVCMITIE